MGKVPLILFTFLVAFLAVFIMVGLLSNISPIALFIVLMFIIIIISIFAATQFKKITFVPPKSIGSSFIYRDEPKPAFIALFIIWVIANVFLGFIVLYNVSSLLILAIMFPTPFILWHIRKTEVFKIGVDPKVKPKQFLHSRKLPPALAGLLVDEYAGFEEIVATILDLNYRGYLSIEEKRKEVILTKSKKSIKNLREYEKLIINKVFKDSNSVKVSEFKNKFWYYIPTINAAVYEEGTKLGLFIKNPAKLRVRYARRFKGILIVAAFAILALFAIPGRLGAYEFASMVSPLLFFLPAIVMNGLLLKILAEVIPRKTELGVQQAQKYEAVRQWLAEHRIENINLSTEFLEYITAFNVNGKYILKFWPMCLRIMKDKRGKKYMPVFYDVPFSYHYEVLDSDPLSAKIFNRVLKQMKK